MTFKVDCSDGRTGYQELSQTIKGEPGEEDDGDEEPETTSCGLGSSALLPKAERVVSDGGSCGPQLSCFIQY